MAKELDNLVKKLAKQKQEELEKQEEIKAEEQKQEDIPKEEVNKIQVSDLHNDSLFRASVLVNLESISYSLLAIVETLNKQAETLAKLTS